MPISIDNLINVNFIKGDLDLLKFGLMLGGRGSINHIYRSFSVPERKPRRLGVST